MTSTHETTWATYQSAWRDISDEQRRALLVDSVAPDGHYRDPQGETTGIEELADYIAGFRVSAPGTTFVNYSFLEHHDEALANWDLNGPDGSRILAGGSHAVFGSDGRLSNIAGFFPVL